MKIFGLSIGTIIFAVLLIIIGKKFGSAIPLIKNV